MRSWSDTVLVVFTLRSEAGQWNVFQMKTVIWWTWNMMLCFNESDELTADGLRYVLITDDDDADRYWETQREMTGSRAGSHPDCSPEDINWPENRNSLWCLCFMLCGFMVSSILTLGVCRVIYSENLPHSLHQAISKSGPLVYIQTDRKSVWTLEGGKL